MRGENQGIEGKFCRGGEGVQRSFFDIEERLETGGTGIRREIL